MNNENITQTTTAQGNQNSIPVFYPSAPAFVPATLKKPPRIRNAIRELNMMGLLTLLQFGISLVFSIILMTSYMFLGLSTADSLAANWLLCVSSLASTALPALIYVWHGKDIKLRTLLDFQRTPPGIFILLSLAGLSICLLGNYPASFLSELLERIGVPSLTESSEISLDPSALPYILTVSFIAPVFEELLFRGVILKRLESFGTGFAIFASALLFALAHMNLSGIVFAFICGLVFGFIYTRTRNLWLPIFIHFLNNTLSILMSLMYSALGERGETLGNFIFLAMIALGILALLALVIFKRKVFMENSFLLMQFDMKAAASIGIIGSADGPTAVYTSEPPLKTGESMRVLRHSAPFWVLLGLTFVLHGIAMLTAWSFASYAG